MDRLDPGRSSGQAALQSCDLPSPPGLPQGCLPGILRLPCYNREQRL
jgi:hypothetical protein